MMDNGVVVDPKSDFNFANGTMSYKSLMQLIAKLAPPQQKFGSDSKEYHGDKDVNVNSVEDSTEDTENPKPTPSMGHTFNKAENATNFSRLKKIHVVHEGRQVHEDTLTEKRGTADYNTQIPLGSDEDTFRKHPSGFVTFAKDFADDEDKEEDDVPEEDSEEVLEPLLKKLPKSAKKVTESADSVKPDTDQDVDEDDIDHMIKKVKDEFDILDAYDDDELVLVDKDENKPVEVKEELISELLTRSERMQVKLRFARSEGKRERKMAIALKKHSDNKTLNRRARHLATNLLKQRLMGGVSVQAMSVSQREQAEKMVASRKNVIDRMAMKLVPRIRKIETDRLTHHTITQGAPTNV